MNTEVTMYGVASCDTVKKAGVALNAAGWTVTLHDVKKRGLPAERLAAWMDALGWEPLVNRRGTTWRGLPPEVAASVVDAASAVAVLVQHPSAMKRPVIAWPSGQVTVGFTPELWPTL